MTQLKYDCVIVGGGAAGLTAATVLARARRRVLLVDEGKQSNQAARASHGVFGHDGEIPENLYAAARQQLIRYPDAETIKGRVQSITPSDNEFIIHTSNDTAITSRSLILAQGVSYSLPDIPGLAPLWGTKAWHCPYCDGYENRDKKLLVVSDPGGIDHTSLILPSWSKNLYYCADSQDLSTEVESRIEKSGGQLRPQPTKFEDLDQGVQVHFTNGQSEKFDAVVIGPQIQPYDNLADRLGCRRSKDGVVERDDDGLTSIPGVYVAGDQTDIMQQVNVAVASGHKAAVSLHEHLAERDRQAE